MRVILLRDVGGVGQKGSVKEVSDGYALNFLFPNRLAEMATTDKVKALEKHQAAMKVENEVREKEYAALAKKLDGQKIEMSANANEQGHLYKKISSEQIARALEEQWKISLPEQTVQPKMAIKQTGEWPVEIQLGSHKATIIVRVL